MDKTNKTTRPAKRLTVQYLSTDSCGVCGDDNRFDDGPDSVCSTCGMTRWGLSAGGRGL